MADCEERGDQIESGRPGRHRSSSSRKSSGSGSGARDGDDALESIGDDAAPRDRPRFDLGPQPVFFEAPPDGRIHREGAGADIDHARMGIVLAVGQPDAGEHFCRSRVAAAPSLRRRRRW